MSTGLTFGDADAVARAAAPERGRLVWLLDRAAAGTLAPVTRS